jgi:hypothetical protein
MECIVDGERTRENGEEVTFLYRLSDGGSPSSYGKLASFDFYFNKEKMNI